jgi:hypothetical protein
MSKLYKENIFSPQKCRKIYIVTFFQTQNAENLENDIFSKQKCRKSRKNGAKKQLWQFDLS